MFVLKTFLFSILVLFVLQMRVGGLTLEEHSQNLVYESRVGHQLQDVALGAVRAGREGWAWLKIQTRSLTDSSSDKRSSVREVSRRADSERSGRSRSSDHDLD